MPVVALMPTLYNRDVVADVVEKVKSTAAEPPRARVTLVTFRLKTGPFARTGDTSAVRFNLPENPFALAIVKVDDPVDPAVSVTEDGLGVITTSWTIRVMVKAVDSVEAQGTGVQETVELVAV
jgi:ribosomal protein L30/L7E